VLVLGSTWTFAGRRAGMGLPPVLGGVFDAIEPFGLIGAYGAFAVMTKSRPEIIVEGSHDGVTWKAYEFPYKPGRLDRMPRQVAPWQPRLDWQMWFAALGQCQQSPWFLSLQRHLMLGTPEVLALLEENPFAGAPPQRVRSTVYQYRYAPLEAKGQWWTRTLQGPFCPELMLDGDGRLVLAQ
jgi:lipase maturation factor 1